MAEINYIEINAENRSITIPQSENYLESKMTARQSESTSDVRKLSEMELTSQNPMCISTSRMHQIRYPEKTDTMPRI